MKRPTAFVLALTAAALCSAADIRPGGGITALAGGGFRDGFSWTDLRVRADGELAVYGESAGFFVQGDVLYDPLDRDAPLCALGEAWAEWETPFGYWKAGRQIVSWGQGLALPVLDVVCPADYSRMFSGEDRDDALPVTAVHWKWSRGAVIAEAVWIPVFAPAVLPDGALPVEAEEPGLEPELGEWGARCRVFLPFADLGVVAYYGWDDLPVSSVDSVGTLHLSHERLLLTGIDAAIPAGPVLIRAEAGISWNRAFSTEVLGEDAHSSHQGALLVGMDWMPVDWRFTIEAYGDWAFRDSQAMAEERGTIVLAGEIGRSFGYGKWEATLGGYWDVAEADWYLNPELVCSPADGLETALGLQVIRGDDSLFAYYEDDAILYSRVKYGF